MDLLLELWKLNKSQLYYTLKAKTIIKKKGNKIFYLLSLEMSNTITFNNFLPSSHYILSGTAVLPAWIMDTLKCKASLANQCKNIHVALKIILSFIHWVEARRNKRQSQGIMGKKLLRETILSNYGNSQVV